MVIIITFCAIRIYTHGVERGDLLRRSHTTYLMTAIDAQLLPAEAGTGRWSWFNLDVGWLRLCTRMASKVGFKKIFPFYFYTLYHPKLTLRTQVITKLVCPLPEIGDLLLYFCIPGVLLKILRARGPLFR